VPNDELSKNCIYLHKKGTPRSLSKIGVSCLQGHKPPPVKEDGKPLLGVIVLNPGKGFNSNPGGYYFLGGYFITINK
jgi:hypothetical protein